jgi:hypothetical protein
LFFIKIGTVGVARIKSIEDTSNGKKYVVDVEKYTIAAQAGTFREIVIYNAIYYLHKERNISFGR